MYRRAQWVAQRPRTPGDLPKFPVNPKTGRAASSTDAATWGTYAEACAMVDAGRAGGMAFAIIGSDPYTCMDLDGCRNAETGAVDPWALEIVERFGTFTEISQSGTGLHIWMLGKIPGERRRTGQIEIYDDRRIMSVTFRPLPGYTLPVRDCQAQLEEFYAELFPSQAEAPTAAPIVLTMDDQEICERIARDPKGDALLSGDVGAYPGYSEARFALAGKLCFYTDDPDQIARIIRSANLFKPDEPERERVRRAKYDAAQALASYTGPRFDPDRRRQGPRLFIPPTEPAPAAAMGEASDTLSVEELRAELAAALQREAAKDAELRAHRQVLKSITTILASDQIEAGPRLTAIGVMLVGLEKQAKDEKPSDVGYHMPASWIANYTGQTDKTVSGHLQKLARRGLIDRTVRREKVQRRERTVDHDTGEILTETRRLNGQRNYIAFPEAGKVISFAERFANYRRDEEAEKTKHGGERIACDKHPEAGTYTVSVTYCRECHEQLGEPTTRHSGPPIGEVTTINTQDGWTSKLTTARHESTPKMGSDPTHVPVDIDIPKMGSDSWSDPASSSDPKMGADSRPPGAFLADGWEEERRQIYGALYRGEVSA